MTGVPPVRWLFGSADQRAVAVRYWIRDTAAGLLNTGVNRALRRMSTDSCSAFGAAVSRLSPVRFKRSDARARRNLALLRPEASDPAWLDAAMHRLWNGLGRTMAEFSVLDRIWNEGRITVEGAENLLKPRSENRPTLIAALHLGNWELIGATTTGLGHKGAGIYLVPNNRFEHRIVVRARQPIFTRLVPALHSGALAAVRELRKHGLIGMFVDDFKQGRVFAPAFGRPLSREGNIAHAVRIAGITGATILPAYCVRLGESARFRVTFLPPMEVTSTGDTAADLMGDIRKLNDIIEPVVRAHLDQWYYLRELEFDAGSGAASPPRSAHG